MGGAQQGQRLGSWGAVGLKETSSARRPCGSTEPSPGSSPDDAGCLPIFPQWTLEERNKLLMNLRISTRAEHRFSVCCLFHEEF